MRAFFFILLLLGGAAFLYDESPEFRQSVDQFAAELEAQSAQSGNPYASPEFQRPEFESTAFDRRDAFRTRSLEPASATVSAPRYGQGDASLLVERNRTMRNNYQQAVDSLRQHHSRDRRVTEGMNGYYQGRYEWDASRNAQGQYRR